MPEYEVEMLRIAYATKIVRVKARNLMDARNKAHDMVGKVDWTEESNMSSCHYEIQSVKKRETK